MKTINCLCEHNGPDTLIYALDFPGAFARGRSPETALAKMPAEIISYTAWSGDELPDVLAPLIAEDVPSRLEIRDADSDVLFTNERPPITWGEYIRLKELALRSANDFLTLYRSVPEKSYTGAPSRRTFYGNVPRTADEMYLHTRSVNEYYFGEIGACADNDGDILDCRARGFADLEKHTDFLENKVFEGSYGELWTLRKLLRRFIWHDRIHAKAMYRMAARKWRIADPFCFGELF